MSLTINAICHGFKVLEASFVEEVHSKAYILEHLHRDRKSTRLNSSHPK